MPATKQQQSAIKRACTCRNKDVIVEKLREVIQEAGMSAPAVLEIASGTGQHISHLATNIPDAIFQPTELSDTVQRCAGVQPYCSLERSRGP